MFHSRPRYGGSNDNVSERVADEGDLLRKHAGHVDVAENLVHEPVSH